MAHALVPVVAALIMQSGFVAAPPNPAAPAPLRVDDPVSEVPGVYGATDRQRREIDDAIARFAEVGLPLPELRIYVHTEPASCNGYLGLFNKDNSGHRIDLCRTGSSAVLHELAHAWEHHFMTDATRAIFLERIGRTVWNHADTPWDERGIEAAARAIAWGLLDEPLTPGEAAEYREALDRYRILTGSVAPRYPHPVPPAPAARSSDDAASAAALLQRAAATSGSLTGSRSRVPPLNRSATADSFRSPARPRGTALCR